MMLLSIITACLLGLKFAIFMVKETEACRNAWEEEKDQMLNGRTAA